MDFSGEAGKILSRRFDLLKNAISHYPSIYFEMITDNPRLKKFLIIAGVLAVAQIIALFVLGSKKPSLPVRQAIEKAVSDVPNVDSDRKQLLKVQLALADFIAKNSGNPPASLNQLIPVYFETLPIDPSTNKPYQYKVEGKRYILGDPTLLAKTTAPQSGVPGEKASEGADLQKEELLKVLKADGPKPPAYDPVGKKDPYRPFDIAPRQNRDANRPPLESQAIDQFSYVAYLQSEGEPKAIVETPERKGYTVSKGSKIGINSGEVTDILPDKLVIVESEIDFTGQRQTKTIEVPIGVRRGLEEKDKAVKNKK